MDLRERVKSMGLGFGFVALDIVQMMYHGENRSVVGNYSHDTILPLICFFSFRSFSRLKYRYIGAVFAFGGCSALEVAQKYGWYHGTYDPKDFLAYAAGTLVALGVDAAVFRDKQSIDDMVR